MMRCSLLRHLLSPASSQPLQRLCDKFKSLESDGLTSIKIIPPVIKAPNHQFVDRVALAPSVVSVLLTNEADAEYGTINNGSGVPVKANKAVSTAFDMMVNQRRWSGKKWTPKGQHCKQLSTLGCQETLCPDCQGYQEVYSGCSHNPYAHAINANSKFIVQVVVPSVENMPVKNMSGFFVNPQLILTSHRVEKAEYIIVRNHFFETKATIVCSDPKYKFSYLKIEEPMLHEQPIFRLDPPSDLEELIALGFTSVGMKFPTVTPTVGYSMGLYKSEKKDPDAPDVPPYIMTSCAESEEMVGGAVVDLDAKIVGWSVGVLRRDECKDIYCHVAHPMMLIM